MEQQLDPSKLIKNEPLAQYARALYAFFTEAEVTGKHFTYADIDAHSSLSASTIRKYARNYWSWFLRKEPEKRGRAAVFSCHGLRGYPEFYFVMAHQYNQAQHYRHFSEALLRAGERTEEARRAKREEIQPTEAPFPPSPDVPGQQLPDELHIEDIPPDEEIEEDELETAEETEIASTERMNTMSFLSFGKNTKREELELLEQIRAEFNERIESLEHTLVEQMRTELPNTIQISIRTLGQTLLGEIQALQVSLEQISSDLSNRTQTFEQTLKEEMQQLNSALDLPQVQTELTNTVQLLEQTLIREIHQLHVSSELSQILEKLEQLQRQVQDLSSLVSQPSPVPEELHQLQERVHDVSLLVQKQAQDHFSSMSQLHAVPADLKHLQQNVEALSLLIAQFSSGEQRAVHQLVEVRIQGTVEAINKLGQDLTSWLKQYSLDLQERSTRAFEKVQQALAEAQQDLYSVTTVLLDGEKDQQTDSIQAISQQDETDTAESK